MLREVTKSNLKYQVIDVIMVCTARTLSYAGIIIYKAQQEIHVGRSPNRILYFDSSKWKETVLFYIG